MAEIHNIAELIHEIFQIHCNFVRVNNLILKHAMKKGSHCVG